MAGSVSLPDLLSRLRFNVDDAGLVRAGAQVSALGKTVESAGTRSDAGLKKVSAGAAVAGAGITAAFALAGRATLGFEKQMSATAAAADATGPAFDRLRDAAIEAGAATAFSASEAARAEEELAKAGVAVADILGGGLRGALDLAAAGTLDLGRAAEISANAMTVFKLTGRDVGHIADVLSAGANKSSADVEGLAQALEQSGLVAAQFGLSLEDTVGVLAQMAQAGLKGSDAGTSLKTALQRFIPQSKEAREAMAALGIEMFDASGRFVGLKGAAQELQDGLGSLSQEQRAQALQTIFGSDAIRAATILYEGGGRAVGEWRGKVDDAGAASETAAKKLDNLAGDLDALGGSIETALIKSGSQANGVLRFMAQQATGAVNALSGLPGPVQATAVGLAGIAGPALLAAGAVGSLLPKIAETRRALEGMGAAGTAASRGLGLLGRASATGVGLVALAGGVEILTDQLLRLQHGPAPKLSEMGNALVRFGETHRAGGELAKQFGSDLGKLADKLKDLEGGVGSGGILGNIFSPNTRSRVKDAKRDLDALDKSFADLVRGGNGDEAARLFDSLAAKLTGLGVSRADLRGPLDDYRAALAEVDTEQRLAGTAAEGLTAKTKDSAAAFGEAAEQARAQAEALDDVLQAAQAQFDSAIAYERAQNGLEDASAAAAAAQKELTDAVSAHGRRSGEAQAAGERLSRAQLDLKASYVDLAQAAVRQADDQAAAAGRTLSEADKYRLFRDKLIELKDTLAPGAALRVALEEMINKIGEIPAEKPVVVKADTAEADAKLTALRQQFDRLATDANAAGPSLFGPVGAGDDERRRRRFGPLRLPAFEHGGLVPGPPNVPTLIVAHGGEQVLSIADRRRLALAAAPSHTTIHNSHTTVVAPGVNADVARSIAVEQARQAAQAR